MIQALKGRNIFHPSRVIADLPVAYGVHGPRLGDNQGTEVEVMNRTININYTSQNAPESREKRRLGGDGKERGVFKEVYHKGPVMVSA